MLHKVCNPYRISKDSAFEPLHRKGLLIVSLIILAESITLSNAVSYSSYWSNYQSRSNSNQNARDRFETNKEKTRFGDFESSDFCRQQATAIQECATRDAGGESTIKTVAQTEAQNQPLHQQQQRQQQSSNILPPPSRLYPRNRRTRTCTKNMYDCCNQTCPSCFLLNVRGGGGQNLFGAAAASASETISNSADSFAIPGSSTFVPTPFDLPLNLWKVIFQIFLTALNVMCWLIPLRAKKLEENELVLSLANAFSGGVFLSLAFGHLIPECIHGFEGYNESLPFMIVLGGYLLIFFVEKVAFDAHGLMNDGTSEATPNAGQKTAAVGKKGAEAAVAEDKAVSAAAGGLNTGRSAVILLGALAVHSILEMTALGLANTFGDTALLSVSIALHQPAESIALLIAFLKSGMPKDQIAKYLSVFSAMGPIGVAIGMGVNEFAAPIVDSIMLATVAGTFIYVGATEVIPEEWEGQEHKYKKFFALISGIVSVFCITQYTMNLEAQTR